MVGMHMRRQRNTMHLRDGSRYDFGVWDSNLGIFWDHYIARRSEMHVLFLVRM